MVSFANNKNNLQTAFLFAVIAFVAFLPISTFLFYIKNDAFSNYFPPKFFMSESIRDGYVPLWNPYINFGIPQYGDMNAGYWSPITWILASTVGYNAYSFTLELLGYIFIGGVGMFKLSGYWIRNKDIRVMMGVSFMCCGYNVAHLQHFNWISGAALLPWCAWSYLILLRRPTFFQLFLSVILFYLFAASAHPGLVIGAAYFFLALLISHFFQDEHKQAFLKHVRQAAGWQLALLGLGLILSMGLIIGYADIIPEFVRGERVKLSDSLPHSSHLSTWISLALPLATVKNPELFNTDLTLRNSYFGLFFFVLLLAAVGNKKTRWQKVFLILGICFALLSAGGIFKTFAHKFLPLVGYVRLNGEFRIFAILSFIIIAGIFLDQVIRCSALQRKQKIIWPAGMAFLLIIISVVWAIAQILITRESLLFPASELRAIHGFSEKAKFIIDSLSFYDTICIQGLLQSIFLTSSWRPFISGNFDLLKKIFIADLVLATLLNVPFTGAGKTPVAHLQSVLDRSPAGIPLPALTPIAENDTIAPVDNALLGEWYLYNKQPGAPRELPYPIQLKNMRQYFDGIQKGHGSEYLDKAFLFSPSAGARISLTGFSPNLIEVTVSSPDASTLVLQQNKYPHWFYNVNGQVGPAQGAGVNFMSAPLQKGDNEVKFFFKPTLVSCALYGSGIVFLVYIVAIILLYKKKL